MAGSAPLRIRLIKTFPRFRNENARKLVRTRERREPREGEKSPINCSEGEEKQFLKEGA